MKISIFSGQNTATLSSHVLSCTVVMNNLKGNSCCEYIAKSTKLINLRIAALCRGENNIARGGVGGGLIVIRYSNTSSKNSRTVSLNSEGMLSGIDNFYFIFITFSFKLELVLIK